MHEYKIIEQLKPKPHPLRDFFLEKKIPQWILARYLGLSQASVSLILSGIKSPSDKIEQKLFNLKTEIQSQ